MATSVGPSRRPAGDARASLGFVDMPVPRQLPVDQIREEVPDLVFTIFTKRNELKTLLEKYGGNVEKRWLRNNKHAHDKRVQALTTVYPKIPAGRRQVPPEKTASPNADAEADFRRASLCPPINTSDLAEDDVPLGAVYYRARHDPCDFISLDLDNTSIDITKHVEPKVNQKLSMRLYNERDAAKYGQIMLASGADMSTALSPGIGLLALEIQVQIYNFYLDFVKEVLRPEFEQLQKSPGGPMMEVPSRLQDRWVEISQSVLRGVYQPLSSITLQGILTLIDTVCTETMDFLANLREDPKVFFDSVANIEETLGPLPEIPGLAATQVKVKPKPYMMATNMLLSVAMSDVLSWNFMRQQIHTLVELESNGQLRKADGGLTAEAFLAFQLLENMVDSFCEQMTLAATYGPETPALLPRASGQKLPKNPTTTQTKAFEQAQREEQARTTLLGLLAELRDCHNKGEDSDYNRDMDKAGSIVAEIQSLIDDHAVVIESFPSFKLRHFGQLAVAAEVRRQLGLFPEKAAWRDEDFAESNMISNTITSITRLLNSGCQTYCDSYAVSPSQVNLGYPSNPKTETSKQLRSQARGVLDRFWEGLDQVVRNQPIAALGFWGVWFEGVLVDVQNIAHFSRTDRESQERMELQAMKPDEEEQPSSFELGQEDEQESSESEGLSEGLQNLSTTAGGESVTAEGPKRPHVPVASEKKKTRGTPAEQDQEQAVEEVPAVEPQPQRIQIDAKAWNILNIGLHMTRAQAPGNVSWNDILYTMRAIGFSIRRTAGVEHIFVHRDGVQWFPHHSAHGDMEIGEFRTFITHYLDDEQWRINGLAYRSTPLWAWSYL
ncbi:hypothetical protein LTR37_012531 [Vermiconidia calcicola]|uniref:Uncharacterized protein n=1 Tax=Vermiconidia calcicola TaxID=1690605 RepID=A0ACC3N0B0_9PEZI|nr:hypothetical protein LTR37_012531 [Vermiconidia calcicola]